MSIPRSSPSRTYEVFEELNNPRNFAVPLITDDFVTEEYRDHFLSFCTTLAATATFFSVSLAECISPRTSSCLAAATSRPYGIHSRTPFRGNLFFSVGRTLLLTAEQYALEQQTRQPHPLSISTNLLSLKQQFLPDLHVPSRNGTRAETDLSLVGCSKAPMPP